MKQLIQSYKTGALGLYDVPAPLCHPEGVLVATTYSLISAGTEKMIVDIAKKSLVGKAQARPDLVRQVIRKMKQEGFRNTLEKVMNKLDTPIPLGYSCSGTVIEAGAHVQGIAAGTRVACGGAGYANHSEINYIPSNLVVPVPDGVDDVDASFVTVGAIALQGVRQANPILGEQVVVIGLGLLGQLTVQILRANGCRVLGCDLDSSRLNLASKLGAQAVCPPDELIEAAREFSHGYGVDAVIITASAKDDLLIMDAGEISRHKGRVIVVGLVGMNIPRDIYYKKELEVKLSMAYGPGRYDPTYEEYGIDYPYAYVRWTERRNFEAFLNLISEGSVTPKELITHTFEFTDALKAFDLITGKSKEPYLGIVLRYPTPSDKTKLPERIIYGEKTLTTPGVLRIGLIGGGNFATSVLLPHLKKNKDFISSGICDASNIVAHSVLKKHGFALASTDPQSFMQSEQLDTVFITTRHDSHAQLVMQALRAGKHTFVEKPLCLHEEDLMELRNVINEIKQPAPVLQVGYNRRFAPLIQTIKKFIGDGPISINYRVNAGIIPMNSWIQDPLSGGGRIIGEVCHFIDTCSYLIGGSVVSVQAAILIQPDQSIPPEDNVHILLHYDNGGLAHISYTAFGNRSLPKEFIELFAGSNISVQMSDFRKLTIYKGSRRHHFRNANQDKGFSAELDAFAGAIKTGRAAIPLESLFNTTLTTFKIREAIRTGSVVPVLG
jgi:predicted dehydrogenase/threonine dehydrogenase-like Zn-dependent dehydrogenase